MRVQTNAENVREHMHEKREAHTHTHTHTRRLAGVGAGRPFVDQGAGTMEVC